MFIIFWFSFVRSSRVWATHCPTYSNHILLLAYISPQKSHCSCTFMMFHAQSSVIQFSGFTMSYSSCEEYSRKSGCKQAQQALPIITYYTRLHAAYIAYDRCYFFLQLLFLHKQITEKQRINLITEGQALQNLICYGRLCDRGS